jgi:hypothetical protein
MDNMKVIEIFETILKALTLISSRLDKIENRLDEQDKPIDEPFYLRPIPEDD